jgi:hypothetical protein
MKGIKKPEGFAQKPRAKQFRWRDASKFKRIEEVLVLVVTEEKI